MARYNCEMSAGGIKSIQSKQLGTTYFVPGSARYKNTTINAVDLNNCFIIEQGGSEGYGTVHLQSSTNLREEWRGNDYTTYWRHSVAIVEQYGGRGT